MSGTAENITADLVNATVAAAAAKTPASKASLIIAFGFMITAATSIIAFVAQRVRVKTIHALQQKTHVRKGNEQNNYGGIQSESFSMQQAIMFPITGSCVLFGLYTAIKYLPKEYLTYFMMGYLSLASMGSLSMAVKPYIGASIPIGSAIVSVVVLYAMTENWLLNNIMAFSLCVVTMETIHLKSFKTGAFLLSALFFYDIFWVFGTDVMVTVATTIKGPIKILFPRDILSGNLTDHTLLGLGDIVIPGFFIVQILRMSLLRSGGRSEDYYKAAMVAYVLSLVNTMSIMVIFNHAQPALLYIVPYLLVAVIGVAVIKGDLAGVFNFDEEDFEKKRLQIEDSVSRSPSTTENKEEEISAWYEISQGVLSLFGQDDEYLKEKYSSYAKRMMRKQQ